MYDGSGLFIRHFQRCIFLSFYIAVYCVVGFITKCGFFYFYSAFQLTKSKSAAHFGSDEVTFDLRCSVV